FFQAEDGIRDFHVTGVQTCALPIFRKQICLHPDATKLRPCALPVLDQSWSTSMPRSSHLILLLGLPLILGASLPRSGPVPEEKRSEERRVGKECRYRWTPDP